MSWRRPRSLAASLLLAGACLVVESRAAAQPAPPLNDDEVVVAVDFDSDEPVDERTLREMLPLRPGEPLTAATLAEARRLLELKQLWSTIEPEVRPAEGGVRVVFHLAIKHTVASVDVSGYETFFAEDLVRRVRIPSGAELKPSTVEEAAERLRQFYRREGFPDVEVTAQQTPKPHRQFDLDFHIDEGKPVLITAIFFEGDLRLPVDDLARSLGVRAGDRRRHGVERQAKRNALEFYRKADYFGASVTVVWEAREDPQRGVLFVVVETRKQYVVRFVGNRELSRCKLLDLIDVTKRPVVTDGTWRELARRIKREYRLRGYYRAEVKLVIDDDGPQQVIEYRIGEGRRYWIHDIEFVGNVEVPAEILEKEMDTRPASWVPFSRAGILDDDVLANDLRKIWFLYRRLGFQSAEVVDSRSSFDEESGAIDLTIEIEEGPRSIVKDVTFTGFEVIAEIPIPRTEAGKPFNPEDRDADVKALVAAVSRAGYPQARVEAVEDSVRAGPAVETTVHFRADPGPYRAIGPLVVQNNLITKDRVVLRELPFEEGDPYDAQAIADAQTDVYRLGLFRRVSVRPLEPVEEKEAPPVGVEVDERPAGTLSYGFGYETDIGVRGFGEVAYDNLQGMNRQISLRGDASVLPSNPSESQYILNLGFRTPRVFESRWTSRSNAILLRNTQTLNRFSIEGFTLATALEREIWPRFVVGALIELDQADTFDVAPDANLEAEGVKDEGFLRQVDFGPFVELDRRDDPFAPRAGTIETLQMKYAEPGLGSDIRFASLIAKHAHYIPLSDDLTLVYALRGAWALPLDGKFSVPIRDRYFLGGRTTVRGFQENSIAPLGAKGNPIGGDVMMNGNLELRFPLVFGLGAAVFLDGGGSFLRNRCRLDVCNFSEASWDNFRRSAGLGLRYLTPVGPISLEYGFKLDRRSGESIGAIHFTIGNIF